MPETLTHAGAVAVLMEGERPLFLVVSSSDGAHWVLPKGHIEAAETAEGAALRELLEEAGVSGTILARLSTLRFSKAGEDVAVSYFLVLADGWGESPEGRTIRWEPEPAALELLSFPDARTVLREAASQLPPDEEAI